MAQTKIIIKNATSKKVTFYLTLGATEGCIQNVSEIPFVENQIFPLQGSFTLEPNTSTAEYAPTSRKGINGNISVGSPPLNCATNKFPNGINLAEFILNNGFQGDNSQETLDISGVAGTNAQYLFDLNGGGEWNAGPAHPNISCFKNKSIGNNIGQVGVYPYACDDCTRSINPPKCESKPVEAPNPIRPQASAICTVQRDAKTKSGGIVTITLLKKY